MKLNIITEMILDQIDQKREGLELDELKCLIQHALST